MVHAAETRFNSENIEKILLDHEIRPTSQRVEIARILLARPQHLSADQVMSKANRQKALVSKATVYNTLKLFAEKGLIRQMTIEPGKVFYDSNTRSHHHFYHEDTGVLEDIETPDIAIANLPDLPRNTVQTGVDVVIRVKNKS